MEAELTVKPDATLEEAVRRLYPDAAREAPRAALGPLSQGELEAQARGEYPGAACVSVLYVDRAELADLLGIRPRGLSRLVREGAIRPAQHRRAPGQPRRLFFLPSTLEELRQFHNLRRPRRSDG